jgi:CheY-like chemotaxis protein
MGFSEYLSKPVKKSSLYHSLSRALTGACQGRGKAMPPEVREEENEEAQEISSKPNRTLRILLAEDNLINQKVAKRMLEKGDILVDVATNGLETLEIYKKLPYDLILMDCQMPDMDGYETTRAIREIEKEGERTPIIAMTANAMVGDREKCLESGMDDYMSKPIDPDLLLEKVTIWSEKTDSDAG